MKHFISLGAGVQSSAMALMAAKGEIGPMPDAAIFADTQAEPAGVYEWLDWLEGQLPFPVYRVTHGSLTEQITTVQRNKSGGMLLRNSIPLQIKNGDGSSGKLIRDCTADFKIKPLLKKQKKLAGIKRGEKEVKVTTWIGISLDEVVRMKPSREKWCQHIWPLVDLRMTRHDCKRWMEKNGYPEPPRSACVYCPFHSDHEWRRLKNDEPEAFAEAVRVEQALQDLHKLDLPGRIKGIPYLNRRLQPLDEIDFSTEEDNGQMSIWGDECEGMCGV